MFLVAVAALVMNMMMAVATVMTATIVLFPAASLEAAAVLRGQGY